MQDRPQDYPDLDDPQIHDRNNNALSTPYPVETTHPPPQPYKLRPKRLQKALNNRKRKTHLHNPHNDNQPQLDTNTQTQPVIKHSSVAQAPLRINMAFPAPIVMPHRNPPMNTSKYKQTRQDRC